MDYMDIVAKNLLENKVCSGCKYYSVEMKFCRRYKPIPISTTDDIEVFINGRLSDELIDYIIKDKKVMLLQHWFEINLGYDQNININNNNNNNNNKIIVYERFIKDGKLVKIKHESSMIDNIPKENTCEQYLSVNSAIYDKI